MIRYFCYQALCIFIFPHVRISLSRPNLQVLKGGSSFIDFVLPLNDGLLVLCYVRVCCNVYVVDLRLVKEVRPGKSSPDFEKWSEEARRHDTTCCFVLFYGREFRLKTLSLAG